MRRMRDPCRVTDAGGRAMPELAAAIRDMRAQQCTPAQVSSLRRALAERTSSGDPPSGSGSLGTSAKYWLGVVVVLGIGFAWQLHRSDGRVAARRTAPGASAPETKAVGVAPAGAAAASAKPPSELAGDPAAAQPTAPRIARKRARTTATAAPEQELSLLRRSHTALVKDPESALALAEEHERLYANGIFAQERELLAIEALLRLGMNEVAVERADRFIRRYPESPHSVRVRAVLERKRTDAGRTDGAAEAPSAR